MSLSVVPSGVGPPYCGVFSWTLFLPQSSRGFVSPNRHNRRVSRPLRERFTPPVRIARWRWFVGTVLILVMWLVGGSLLSLVILPWTGVDLENFFNSPDMFSAFPSWGFLLFALVSFIPLFIGVLIAYRWILGVKLTRLFAVGVPFRWWRVGWGALVWLLVMAGPALFAIAVSPEQFESSFNWATFVPYALIALTLLPIQTTAEELFFRGWLIQGLSQRYSNIWLLSIASGLIFALPHLANPEAAGAILPAMFGYATIGFALAWVSVRDRSLEIAIGAHAANNLFASLIVGYEGGALPAEAPFIATGDIDWGADNVVTLVLIPLFIFASRLGYVKNPRSASM